MKHFKILLLTSLLAILPALFFALPVFASTSLCSTYNSGTGYYEVSIPATVSNEVIYYNLGSPANTHYAGGYSGGTYSGTRQTILKNHTYQINWPPFITGDPLILLWGSGNTGTYSTDSVSATYSATYTYNGSGYDAPACGPSITITSPATATTETDPTTNLSGSWSSIDPAIYSDIRLYFHHTGNGVDTVSAGKIIPITSSGGSFSIPLSDFEFDYNGDWVLTAVADLKAPQLSDFIQTTDLTSPTGFHLNINFSALTTPFTFSDWPTWYTTNAAGGYSAPSDFGNSFVGFFKPIFENAFGFANQVLKYFDATQAEARGQQLGSVFPVTDAYLKKIDLFFGGFPLSAFFLFVVIVMLAIFAIRTIFKFIPFFG